MGCGEHYTQTLKTVPGIEPHAVNISYFILLINSDFKKEGHF